MPGKRRSTTFKQVGFSPATNTGEGTRQTEHHKPALAAEEKKVQISNLEEKLIKGTLHEDEAPHVVTSLQGKSLLEAAQTFLEDVGEDTVKGSLNDEQREFIALTNDVSERVMTCRSIYDNVDRLVKKKMDEIKQRRVLLHLDRQGIQEEDYSFAAYQQYLREHGRADDDPETIGEANLLPILSVLEGEAEALAFFGHKHKKKLKNIGGYIVEADTDDDEINDIFSYQTSGTLHCAGTQTDRPDDAGLIAQVIRLNDDIGALNSVIAEKDARISALEMFRETAIQRLKSTTATVEDVRKVRQKEIGRLTTMLADANAQNERLVNRIDKLLYSSNDQTSRYNISQSFSKQLLRLRTKSRYFERQKEMCEAAWLEQIEINQIQEVEAQKKVNSVRSGTIDNEVKRKLDTLKTKIEELKVPEMLPQLGAVQKKIEESLPEDLSGYFAVCLDDLMKPVSAGLEVLAGDVPHLLLGTDRRVLVPILNDYLGCMGTMRQQVLQAFGNAVQLTSETIQKKSAGFKNEKDAFEEEKEKIEKEHKAALAEQQRHLDAAMSQMAAQERSSKGNKKIKPTRNVAVNTDEQGDSNDIKTEHQLLLRKSATVSADVAPPRMAVYKFPLDLPHFHPADVIQLVIGYLTELGVETNMFSSYFKAMRLPSRVEGLPEMLKALRGLQTQLLKLEIPPQTDGDANETPLMPCQTETLLGIKATSPKAAAAPPPKGAKSNKGKPKGEEKEVEKPSPFTWWADAQDELSNLSTLLADMNNDAVRKGQLKTFEDVQTQFGDFVRNMKEREVYYDLRKFAFDPPAVIRHASSMSPKRTMSKGSMLPRKSVVKIEDTAPTQAASMRKRQSIAPAAMQTNKASSKNLENTGSKQEDVAPTASQKQGSSQDGDIIAQRLSQRTGSIRVLDPSVGAKQQQQQKDKKKSMRKGKEMETTTKNETEHPTLTLFAPPEEEATVSSSRSNRGPLPSVKQSPLSPGTPSSLKSPQKEESINSGRVSNASLKVSPRSPMTQPTVDADSERKPPAVETSDPSKAQETPEAEIQEGQQEMPMYSDQPQVESEDGSEALDAENSRREEDQEHEIEGEQNEEKSENEEEEEEEEEAEDTDKTHSGNDEDSGAEQQHQAALLSEDMRSAGSAKHSKRKKSKGDKEDYRRTPLGEWSTEDVPLEASEVDPRRKKTVVRVRQSSVENANRAQIRPKEEAGGEGGGLKSSRKRKSFVEQRSAASNSNSNLSALVAQQQQQLKQEGLTVELLQHNIDALIKQFCAASGLTDVEFQQQLIVVGSSSAGDATSGGVSQQRRSSLGSSLGDNEFDILLPPKMKSEMKSPKDFLSAISKFRSAKGLLDHCRALHFVAQSMDSVFALLQEAPELSSPPAVTRRNSSLPSPTRKRSERTKVIFEDSADTITEAQEAAQQTSGVTNPLPPTSSFGAVRKSLSRTSEVTDVPSVFADNGSFGDKSSESRRHSSIGGGAGRDRGRIPTMKERAKSLFCAKPPTNDMAVMCEILTTDTGYMYPGPQAIDAAIVKDMHILSLNNTIKALNAEHKLRKHQNDRIAEIQKSSFGASLPPMSRSSEGTGASRLSSPFDRAMTKSADCSFGGTLGSNNGKGNPFSGTGTMSTFSLSQQRPFQGGLNILPDTRRIVGTRSPVRGGGTPPSPEVNKTGVLLQVEESRRPKGKGRQMVEGKVIQEIYKR